MQIETHTEPYSFKDYYNNDCKYSISYNSKKNILNIDYLIKNEIKFSGIINEILLNKLKIKLSVKNIYENFKNANENFERELKLYNIVYHTILNDSELSIKFVCNDNENDKFYYEYIIYLFNGIKMKDCTTIKVKKFKDTSKHMYIHYIYIAKHEIVYNGRTSFSRFWKRMYEHKEKYSDIQIIKITFGDAWLEDVIYLQNKSKYKNTIVLGGSFTSPNTNSRHEYTISKMQKTAMDKCFNCNETGHYSASCPNKIAGKKRSREEYENVPAKVAIPKIEEPSQCLKEPVPITKESDKKE